MTNLTPDNTEFNGPAHLQIQSRSHLDQLLTEGRESGDAVELTDQQWEAKRQRLLERTRHRFNDLGKEPSHP
jgi:uncharacterized protein YoaH (UPF0181 family)